MTDPSGPAPRPVTIPAGHDRILADLLLPARADGLVVFAHGSGSGRHSPRNVFVARSLERIAIGSLLVDLLTANEAEEDELTGRFRFDIPRLSDRLVACLDWIQEQAPISRLPVGLYGASTGGAAALIAASRRPDRVRAIVLRGARSDLAEETVERVRAPTRFLVGSRDREILALNERTASRLGARHDVVVVPGAGHLFEEPGALPFVAERTGEWFRTEFSRAAEPGTA